MPTGHRQEPARARSTVRTRTIAPPPAEVVGLPWSGSTVAAADLGTKTLDLAEILLLAGWSAAVWPTCGRRRGRTVGAIHPHRLGAVRVMRDPASPGTRPIGGPPSSHPPSSARVPRGTGSDGILSSHPEVRERPPVMMGPRRRRSSHPRGPGRSPPRPTSDGLHGGAVAAVRAASGEVRQGGTKTRVPALDLSLAAVHRWGRSLTEERDARVALGRARRTSRGALTAVRRHVTRQLLAKLEPILKEQ